MHGLPSPDFARSVCGFLTAYYALAAGVNVFAAARAACRSGVFRALLWSVVAVVFGCLAWEAHVGRPLALTESTKAAVDTAVGPVSFTLGSFAILTVFLVGRRFFTIPAVAWVIFNGSVLAFGAAMTDANFAGVVSTPDNVPIVAMVFLLGAFTWWGVAQGVENDHRAAEGKRPVEADYSEEVLVWPDVIYLELIGAVLATVGLIVWSMLISAPLEGPANPAVTPNPSKAPWYFVGLQEMLVSFDPWMAGVVLPLLIIIGLCAIPYLDKNPKGNGYYTIKERKVEVAGFLFGFLQLWILLILIGTFMRGPNWTFFGPFEYRDPHKIVSLENVKLSEVVWTTWLGRSVPQAAAGSGFFARLGTIALRESVGVVLLIGYFIGLPWVAAKTVFLRYREKLGGVRYWFIVFLFLMMLMLPIKMLLRWTCGANYVVSIPEWFLNF